jgi:hypothetical protein
MTPNERWLRVARVTDDPAGDLIADMRADRRLPALFPGSMRAYLKSLNACSGALEAVPIVWRRYQSFLGRNPA